MNALISHLLRTKEIFIFISMRPANHFDFNLIAITLKNKFNITQFITYMKTDEKAQLHQHLFTYRKLFFQHSSYASNPFFYPFDSKLALK